MNILILSWRGPGHPLAGGAEIVTHEHAKAWVKAGHEVTLFTSQYAGGKREEVIDGVKVIRKGNQVPGVQLRAVKFVLQNDEKFDLIIDQFHGIPFFTPLYSRAKRIGFIHEVAKEVWLLNPWPKPFNLIPALIGRIFEPVVFLFYRKTPFVTVSRSTRSDLVRWGIPNRNIFIINNGIIVQKPRSLKKENKKTAIFLGALSKDKGIEDAIHAFSEINKLENNWQFWVVGKSTEDYLKNLKDLSKELGVDGQIKFWGFVDEKKKFELLAKAHVLINPSVREGWGLVNIEANAVGTPVVAYNVAGVRDSVKDKETGILVRPGDYRSLAESTVELLSNPKRYRSLQDEAAEWSKEFTWQRATEKSLGLIEKI